MCQPVRQCKEVSKYGVVQDQGQRPIGGIRLSMMSGHFDAIGLPTPPSLSLCTARVAAVPTQTDRQTHWAYCYDCPPTRTQIAVSG